MIVEEMLPKIVVGAITENEDGSANVELHLEPEAVSFLIQVGFERLMKDYLEDKVQEEWHE
jgi:hypothetical protein